MRLWRVGASMILAGLAVGGATPICAATIDTDTETIEGREITFISVTGELVSGDEESFADAVIRVKAGAVVFDSPGGDLVAGIEIGKAIRLKGLKTLVAGGDMCASACALAWLGGIDRFMADGARIGFHAVTLVDDPAHRAHSVGNALVGAYLNQLGLPDVAVAYITQAQPNEMQWLTLSDAARVGIAVERLTSPQEEEVPAARTEQPPVAERERPEPAAPASWASLGEWIQLFSRDTVTDATALASDYHRYFANTEVFRYDNGWYVVVLGPYPQGTARNELDRLLSVGLIPEDSLVTQGLRFADLVWGEMPRRPAISRVAPEAIATAAAEEYFRSWSSSDADAFAFLNNAYPNVVVYFGKPTPRADVLLEKAQFAERWPSRRYVISPYPAVTCRQTGKCEVTGLFSWHVYSAARNTTSVGTARFSLTIGTVGPLRIVAESSEVLTRNIRKGR